jgi:NAD(P)-dependent dehydrogenase (short-subunit alcohol dehydrogenase family)
MKERIVPIGLATAKALIAEGGHVYVTGRRPG